MPGKAVTERSSNGRPAMVRPPSFTGREQELAAVTAALASPPAVVLVEGETGIGKSRLIQQFLSSPAGQHRRMLVAACPPFRRPHTLGPVADALRHTVSDVAGLRLSALAGALRSLFPDWADGLPPALEPIEDATAVRHRVFAALAELIERLGISVIVAEDAHWADEATLEFLLFLAASGPPPRQAAASWSGMRGPSAAAARPAAPTRPSLVITVRPEDIPDGSLLPRLARLAAGVSGLRLTLGPLGLADTADLVSSMLSGEHLSEEFAAFMHEHTSGVPLAVEESVRLMAARADLRLRGGRWVRRELAGLAVPPPVRDGVLEGARRLARDAQAVLRAASVLGEPTAETTLTAVSGIGAVRAGAGMTAALASGLLVPSGRGLVAFRHMLACQAVYESVPCAERRALHQRARQALEGLSPPPLAALARHSREAGDTKRWAQYGEQAADLALTVGDEATAMALMHDLVTAADLPASAVARLTSKIVLLALPADDQLRGLTGALTRALDSGALTTAEEAVLRFQLGRTLLTMHEYDAGRAELERAVAGLPPGSFPAVRAMMLLGWPQGGNCPAAEHLRWLRRAADGDASVPHPERLRLLVDRASALLLLGEQAGWAEAARIPWQAATPSDRLQVIRAQGNLGESAMLWGRYAEARRRLDHAVALADRHHYARFRGAGLVMLAQLDWFTGAWAGLAERAAALAADDDLQAADRLGATLVTGLLHAASGAGEQAIRDLGRVADDAERRGAVAYVCEPAAALARLHLARGEAAQALKVTEEPARIVARKGIWAWAAGLAPARAGALVAAGRGDEAAALVGAFARGLRGRDVPPAMAGLTLCRALLAEARSEPARAAVLFARAAAAWQALPRPYEALVAWEGQARCLIAAAQRKRGIAVLAEAGRGLSGLGADGDAERVVRCLRGYGVPVWRGWRGGRRGYGDRLSPRELEVVRLVAAGGTNKQIASALCRSPRTVETQVYSAMRKLGASSRAALAAAAVDGRLPGIQ